MLANYIRMISGQTIMLELQHAKKLSYPVTKNDNINLNGIFTVIANLHYTHGA